MKFMIEVHVKNYINLAMARSKRSLDHILDTTMHGMRRVFPASTIDSGDPISEKKMIRKYSQGMVERGVLGKAFKGVEKRESQGHPCHPQRLVLAHQRHSSLGLP